MLRFSSSVPSTHSATTTLSSCTSASSLTSPPVKRRRGRQPRPSSLSPSLRTAISTFAARVGQPRVIEPAGFRDFRGWLAFVNSPAVEPLWQPITHLIHTSATDNLEVLKADIVREIVRIVVVPRPNEPSKLVSTNCGRQCARPSNGITLMTILDKLVCSHTHQSNASRINLPVSKTTRKKSNLATSSSPLLQHSKFILHHHHYSSPSQSQSQSHTQKKLERSLSSLHNSQCTSSLDNLLNAAQQAGSLDDVDNQPMSASSGCLPSFRELESSLIPPASSSPGFYQQEQDHQRHHVRTSSS